MGGKQAWEITLYIYGRIYNTYIDILQPNTTTFGRNGLGNNIKLNKTEIHL